MQTVSVGFVGRLGDANSTNFEAVFLCLQAIFSRPFMPFSGLHFWCGPATTVQQAVRAVYELFA